MSAGSLLGVANSHHGEKPQNDTNWDTNPDGSGWAQDTGAWCQETWSYMPPPTVSAITLGSTLLVGVSISLCVFAIAFIVIYRQRPVIKMSQPYLMLSFVSSFLFMNVAVLFMLFGIARPDKRLCMAFEGTINLAFTLMVSSMLAKEIRVLDLHLKSERLKKSSFKPLYGYIGIAICVLLTAALLTTWFIVGTPFPDSCHQYLCTLNDCPYGIAVWVEQGVLAFILLLVSLLTLRVTRIASEARWILFMAAAATVVIAVVAGLLIHGELSIENTGITLASGITFITVIALSTIVFRRAFYIDMTTKDARKLFLDAVSMNDSYSTSSSNSTRTLDKTSMGYSEHITVANA